jgi:alpha-amylase
MSYASTVRLMLAAAACAAAGACAYDDSALTHDAPAGDAPGIDSHASGNMTPGQADGGTSLTPNANAGGANPSRDGGAPPTTKDGGVAPQENAAEDAILFQGFHWRSATYGGRWYDTLADKASDLKDLGISHVWFPPPSDSASIEGYLPRQLNVLDSKYGPESALRNAIFSLAAQGISSVADIVVNHRVGTTGWADFSNPSWGKECDAVASSDEWTGRCGESDTGEAYSAARDLDHTKLAVSDGIKTWLRERIRSVGFSGLRFDFAKGFAPKYVEQYNTSFGSTFCVGEIWGDFDPNNPDAHRRSLMSWIDGTNGRCSTFDFTTKGLLNDAFASGNFSRLRDAQGKAGGAIGWWPKMQVTFVDNHDTGPAESCASGQNLWALPCDSVIAAYAYVLSHPGVPSIFYPHVYDWSLRAPIKEFISLRRNAGIRSTSALMIIRAEAGLYAAKISGTRHDITVKIGSKTWDPGSGWTLVASGRDYAVWQSMPPAGPVNRP